MPWETFEINGVAPAPHAMLQFTVDYTPIVETQDRRTATGTIQRRWHWRKNRITIRGSGYQPLYLPGVDFSAPVTLTIRTPIDSDIWQDTNFTVLANEPVIHHDPILKYTNGFTIECEEVDATVLHNLPFTFVLGGQTPDALSILDFTQRVEDFGGRVLRRTGNGGGVLRQHWLKKRFSISAGGWTLPEELFGLDWSSPLTLIISEPNGKDVDGNQQYINTNYTVAVTQPPARDQNMVDRLYRWSILMEEV